MTNFSSDGGAAQEVTPSLKLLVQTECVRTHVVRVRAKATSTKVGIIANEVRAHARLRARADVLATKLGIILLFLFFFIPITYFSPRTRYYSSFQVNFNCIVVLSLIDIFGFVPELQDDEEDQS